MTPRRALALGSLALLLGGMPGCATKHDIRDLQTQLLAMQARQDSLYRLLQRQNREVLDSVRSGNDLLVRVRGDLGHQLLALEQQVVQVQALTGQSQQTLQQLHAQLQQRQEQLAALPGTDTTAGPASAAGERGAPGAPAAPGTAPSAAQLYGVAQTQLQNGAASTARLAFQQLLRTYPGDTLAAAAQYGVAESYVMEDSARAVREFDRVVELYPNSPRAPAALLRAGTLQEGRGNVTRAREYFQRVLARYPKAPEAAQARRALERLRRRRSSSGRKRSR